MKNKDLAGGGVTRRAMMAGVAGGLIQRSETAGPLIDTHIHLFDPAKFPYHSQGTYQPPAAPLEPYLDFVKASGIDHVVIVHPEPYQDDHRYLEHCFANERPRGLFKGTMLLDPIADETPGRMEKLMKANPGRIVGLRIHAMNRPGEAPLERGPIKNRDLRDPRMKKTWAKAADLGIAVQMHFLPHHAGEISALAREFSDVPVILDHMGRYGMGTAKDLDAILDLGKFPRTYFKYSGVGYSSKTKFPHIDVKPVLKRAYSAFGAGRLLWGGLGDTMDEFKRAQEMFAAHWDFAASAERAQIRGLNAKRLYGF